MVEKTNKGDEELPDYDAVEFEDFQDQDAKDGAAAGVNGQDAKGVAQAKPSDYVGVHSTSFKDMLLKPEL